jgi:hypothetical protein
MAYGYIGKPTNAEEVRKDFEEFVAELETRAPERVGVVFGFAWGNLIYEQDWIELDLTGSELRSRVAEAEAAGLGSISTDDLTITLPALGVKRHYCHEADIHVTAEDVTHPYVEAERQRWLDRGWEVYDA